MRLATLILVTGAVLLSGNTAASDKDVRTAVLTAFDALCVLSRFDQSVFVSQIRHLEHRELAPEFLRGISPDTKVGHMVKVEGVWVAATMARKLLADGSSSRSCTITIKDFSFEQATEILESSYRTRIVDRFKQGVSELAVYKSTLVGFNNDMGLSIQSSLGLTGLSIFEIPPK